MLHIRSTFSRSVVVPVSISKLGLTDLIFVHPGVKINGGYYCDMLLSQQLLLVMRDVSGDFFIFQDSVPAHRSATLIDFLSSQHPFSLLQICGRRIEPTLVRSTSNVTGRHRYRPPSLKQTSPVAVRFCHRV